MAEIGACKSLIQPGVQSGAFQLPAVHEGWGLHCAGKLQQRNSL